MRPKTLFLALGLALLPAVTALAAGHDTAESLAHAAAQAVRTSDASAYEALLHSSNEPFLADNGKNLDEEVQRIVSGEIPAAAKLKIVPAEGFGGYDPSGPRFLFFKLPRTVDRFLIFDESFSEQDGNQIKITGTTHFELAVEDGGKWFLLLGTP